MTTTIPTEGQIYVRSSSQANLFKKPKGKRKSVAEQIEEQEETLNKIEQSIKDIESKLSVYRAEYEPMNKTLVKAAKKKEQIEKAEISLNQKKEAVEIIRDKIQDLKSNPDDPYSIAAIKQNASVSFIKECLKLYIGHCLHRYESLDNKYITKGKTSEEQGITLLSLDLGVMLIKNTVRLYNNEYMNTGEVDCFEPRDINNPSVLNARWIYDVKCSWDVHTWHRSAFDDLKDIYEWQGHDYTLLTGADGFTIAHILLSTPYLQVLDEIKKKTFKYDGDDLPNAEIIKIIAGMVYEKETFDNYLNAYGIDPTGDEESSKVYHDFVEIPLGKQRVHKFTVLRDESKFELIKEVNHKAVTFIKEELMTGNWRNGSLSQEEEQE